MKKFISSSEADWVAAELPGACTNVIQILLKSCEHTEDCQTVVKHVTNPL